MGFSDTRFKMRDMDRLETSYGIRNGDRLELGYKLGNIRNIRN
jgi:hypothetical protein